MSRRNLPTSVVLVRESGVMMTAPKPPTGLPGSIGIHLPAFKRKRIEQWCEDVSQYLKAGSLCRSVIGHTVEDNRLPGPMVKSAPAGSHQRSNYASANSAAVPTSTTITVSTTTPSANVTSMGTMTEMLSLNPNKNSVIANGIIGTKLDTAPPPGRGTPMPDASGPLPVVKFSYSHYNEQRRRVDRLVQGLPVLSATGTPNAAQDSGAVVFVSGEEPVKSAGFRTVGTKADRPGRAAGRVSPAPGPDPRSTSRSSSGEHRQRPLPVGLPRHQSVSPSPTRNPPHHTQSSQPHRGPQGSGKMHSSEIVVIENDYLSQNHHSDSFAGPGLPSMKLSGLKRSQSLKVQKARQRMLAGTRRPGDQNSHTHVPVQSCWALAELTW